MSAREANRKSRKLFPLVKIAKKHGGVPIHLQFAKASKLVIDLHHMICGLCYVKTGKFVSACAATLSKSNQSPYTANKKKSVYFTVK